MKEIILATGSDEKYYQRALPYLKSVSRYSTLENFCFCVDFEPTAMVESVAYEVVDPARLVAPLNNACLQHGEFVRIVDFHPSDVVIFTDADLRMQRAFTEDELSEFLALNADSFMVGFNAGPRDTLRKEAHRLGLLKSEPELEDAFGNLDSPCYNVGVAAARAECWDFICGLYAELFPEISTFFAHVARQQWLISWIVNSYLLPVPMPLSIHAHGHYGMPAGCCHVGSEIHYEGGPVVFRHKL